MTQVRLDWRTAEVTDGELMVKFNDRAPKKWRDALIRAVTLLGHGTWALREVRQSRVRIAPVEPGYEERVRHFLESAVLEANLTLAKEEELFDPLLTPDFEDVADADDPHAEDHELTERFRAFAHAGR